MELQELETRISIMLNVFMLETKKASILKGAAVVFLIEDFGTIVCGINRSDYSHVDTLLKDRFKGWRYVYITTQESIDEKRYEVLWDLMRGGYMKWVRTNHPRQIRNILMGIDNLGNKIIQERLRIWADNPKHLYLIEDNKSVLSYGALRELSHDPGFFDYMPEEIG